MYNIKIITSYLPDGKTIEHYATTLEASTYPKTEAIKWSCDNELPFGFSLDEDTGVLSGETTDSFIGTITIRAKRIDSGDSDYKRLLLIVTDKEENYFDCTILPLEIETGGKGQCLSINLTPQCDLFFNAKKKKVDSLNVDTHIDITVPYGQDINDLSANTDINVEVPTSWNVEKTVGRDDVKICWRISGDNILHKNETLTLSLTNIQCNEKDGYADIIVDCTTLIVLEGKTFVVKPSLCLQILKSKRPIINSFDAKENKNENFELKAGEYTNIYLLNKIPSIPVNIRPYASPDPPSPTPHPVPQTKTIIVSWDTSYSSDLVLSTGDRLIEKKGEKQITVDKSMNSIGLTAYSSLKTFKEQRIIDIT